ncbi:hypothetical protein [Nocardia sp. CS682]|uniref:hypothetical protein n=1 Tax=Nocardia sp. CS682 TaxID=1047172 RepID=UPI00107563C9|nr:hypothetical protein [Nocardia sp. CS682]
MTTPSVQKTGHHEVRTDREARAMYALVQQRAIQVDLLAEFLGTGRNHVYELREHLEAAGLVHPLMRVGPGPKWVVPTRPAVTRFFGTSRPDWRPSPLWSVRGRAITRTRIALGATAFDAWESERELSYRAHHPRRYPYDGRTVRTDAVSRAVLVLGHRDTSGADLVHQVSRAGRFAAEDGCTELLLVHHQPADLPAVRTACDKAALPVSLAVSAVTLTALTWDGPTAIRTICTGRRLKLAG